MALISVACIIYWVDMHVTCQVWQVSRFFLPCAYSALHWLQPMTDCLLTHSMLLAALLLLWLWRLQVNGKMRGTVEVGVSIDQAAAVEAALGLNTVKKFTDGKEIKKVIYVPGKILNLIVPGK